MLSSSSSGFGSSLAGFFSSFLTSAGFVASSLGF